MPSGKLTLEEAYVVTKNRPEAWLLRHLTFWHPKATAEKDGKKWVVRNVQEFIEDWDCLWGEQTIRKAISSLEKKGLIEKTQSYHPFKAGVMRAFWLRVVPTNSVNNTESLQHKVPDQSGTKYHSLVQEGYQEELYEVHGDTSPEGKSSLKKKKQEGKVKPLGNKTANTIKKTFKPNLPKKGKILRATELFNLLRYIQYEADPEHPLGDATGWNMGNCKTILKRLREEGLSDDQIREHLEFLLMHWVEFKDYMVMHANKKLPWYATIPVITTNVDHGLLFVKIKKDYEDTSDGAEEGWLTEEEALAKLHSED